MIEILAPIIIFASLVCDFEIAVTTNFKQPLIILKSGEMYSTFWQKVQRSAF